MASGDTLETLVWPLCGGLAITAIVKGFSSAGGNELRLACYIFPIALIGASLAWLDATSAFVTEPYLDEIFHIPQAQKYCQGLFLEWDDKITTPPGLYLASVALPHLFKIVGWISSIACDVKTLRLTNVFALVYLCYLALVSRQAIERQLSRRQVPTGQGCSNYALHTAFNIGLFPLLFFFSGLYYTDVLSTAVVLIAFVNHLSRVEQDEPSVESDLVTILLGVLTLFMRQTNVFWVVVFMGGLEAVNAVKTLRLEQVEQPKSTSLWAQIKFFAWRYSVGDVHDPSVNKAYPDDLVFTVLSLGIAALCNPIRVVRQIWPYVTVLGLFGAFVFWNGGVVLGDKSNHVATIHLAQMLYIWPFFAFFSAPLLLPSLLHLPNALIKLVNNGITASATKSTSPDVSFILKWTATFFNSRILWPIYLLVTLAASFLVVKFNTIIHPFTLADNRHYMFYIFRYTIRRATWIRFALILPYTVSRWMVWDTLGGCIEYMLVEESEDQKSEPFVNYPLKISTGSKKSQKVSASDLKKQSAATDSHMSTPPVGSDAVPVSTSLIFLLATSLSLITAPLVEPRYFIIPWVMWRLMVPSWQLPTTGALSYVPGSKQLATFANGYDVRLVLETIWFILVNALTGYIFLYKGYVWKAEDGTVLEGGQLQRFMW